MRLAFGQSGMTILELLAATGVLGITLGAAVPRLNAGARSGDTAARVLMANLRLSRAQAIGGGYHYRVNFTSASTYVMERMVPPASGSTWTADTSVPARTIVLPSSVRATSGIGSYEFDTRGASVNASTVANLTLHESVQNRDFRVQVWPSGQVNLG